jgi:putative ABC transport system ATP-binding protein
MEQNGPLVILKGIYKSYHLGKQTVPVLFDVNLEIPGNTFAVIQGPSGSGKSTLLNILGCIDRPDRGEYLLEGRAVTELASTRIARIRNEKIGFVFQNFNLLPRMTLFNNVQLPLIYSDMGGKERKIRVREALEKVGLWDRRDHRPNEISGGQRQRAAIARALVTRPSLILADEPTGNLDSATTREVMEVFTRLHNEGNTIVLITHETDVAAYGQSCFKLVDGRLNRADD